MRGSIGPTAGCGVFGSMPCPTSGSMYGAVGVLAVISSIAARGPWALGVNENVIVQTPLTASDPHVDETVKSEGLTPPMTTLLMLIGAVPTFCSVIVCGGLLCPSRTDPNPTAFVPMCTTRRPDAVDPCACTARCPAPASTVATTSATRTRV